MVIDEAALRAAITDALLRSAGLPTLDDVEKMLSKAEKSTTVIIVADGSRYGKAGADLVKRLVGKYESIEVKVSEKSSWPSDLPPPLIVVEGVSAAVYCSTVPLQTYYRQCSCWLSRHRVGRGGLAAVAGWRGPRGGLGYTWCRVYHAPARYTIRCMYSIAVGLQS